VTDKVLVTVRPPVPANAGRDTIAVLGQPHQLKASGGSTFMWSPSVPLNSPFAPNPLATLRNDTKFTVVVTDIAGCLGYDTVFVKVYNGPTYYTPNAFSPNGDGLNDIFRAIPVGIKATEYFRVFNRYGQMMFETNEWLKGWNGRYLGKLQPAGVYVWILKGIDNTGKTIEMKGTVMLFQ
jgi:gliding motility-associated-like protein